MYKLVESTNTGSISSVLLNFENGILKPNEDKALACKIYNNTEDEKIVAVATDEMVYSEKIVDDEFYDNFILICRKNSDKIVMVKTNSVTLKPMISKRKLDDYEEDDHSEVPKNISLSELNKQFGSKRARVVTEQRERSTLNIENVKQQLQETVADIVVKDEDLIVNKTESYEYCPPINRNASRVEDVYVLTDIVPMNVLNSITEEAERILEAVENEEQRSALITQKIQELRKVKSKDSVLKCKIFLYTDCLLHFLKCAAKEIAKKDFTTCSYSENVNKDILSKFSLVLGNKRSRPKAMRDKTLYYILVLTILACNNEIDLEDLAKEVRMGLKALQDTARYLGFTLQGKSNCILKLPIPSPVSYFRGKRKR